MNQSEGAELEFTVEHAGGCTGEVEVNDSISYDDREGNIANFPSPTILVDCGTDIIPEPCPEPVEISIHGCEDTVEIDAGDLEISSLGRILQLDVTLNNICPYKRVALAVILNEIDDKGEEYKRGLKTMVIPAHTSDSCRDVLVRCIKFVLPEELDVSGTPGGICSERNFTANFIAHYIDNDFECCEEVK